VARDHSLVLVNCNVVPTPPDASVLYDQGLWIEGNRIHAIAPVDEVHPEATRHGAVVLDLGGAFVLPGLINMHVHFGLALPGQDLLRRESLGTRVLRMAAHARDGLESGVTTVRLLGEADGADFALRDAIERGYTTGPRIFTAGAPLVCTGGHGHDLVDAFEADGADGFRRATRLQLRSGVDLIKICISGGIAGENEKFAAGQMTSAEMSAVAETAHAWGRIVTAHAGPADVIAEAIDCGIDNIEHGYFLTDGVAKKMASAGTWLVPTIGVSRAQAFLERIGAPNWMIERSLAAGEQHWEALGFCIKARVAMAMGTDMLPAEPFDDTTASIRELELMVEAGMSVSHALAAATTNAARLLGVAESLGSLEPGKCADVIAVPNNPVTDISALRDITTVIKDGRVVRGGVALAWSETRSIGGRREAAAVAAASPSQP
jgi:imidazolonepropionase-like amidohydrolase